MKKIKRFCKAVFKKDIYTVALILSLGFIILDSIRFYNSGSLPWLVLVGLWSLLFGFSIIMRIKQNQD